MYPFFKKAAGAAGCSAAMAGLFYSNVKQVEENQRRIQEYRDANEPVKYRTVYSSLGHPVTFVEPRKPVENSEQEQDSSIKP